MFWLKSNYLVISMRKQIDKGYLILKFLYYYRFNLKVHILYTCILKFHKNSKLRSITLILRFVLVCAKEKH
jgi:hypothetical protein